MVDKLLIFASVLVLLVGGVFYAQTIISMKNQELKVKDSKINTLSKERDDLNITIVESEAKRDFESIEEAIEYESLNEKQFTKRMIEDESITTFNDNF